MLKKYNKGEIKMAVPIKQLKPGNAYLDGNDLYLCLSNEQNKQARLSGQYKVKRNYARYYTGSDIDGPRGCGQGDERF